MSFSDFNSLDYLLTLTGEFIYTHASIELMLSNNINASFIDTISFAILRVFPSYLNSLLLPDYYNFRYHLDYLNPLPWGLAGSVISEFASFQDPLIFIISTFLFGFYSIIIEYMAKIRSNFFISTYFFSILLIQPIYRTTFSENALYPFYLVFFTLPWIYIFEIKFIRNRPFESKA